MYKKKYIKKKKKVKKTCGVIFFLQTIGTKFEF